MKVGSLTFGGGYAMIPIIQKEVVDKRRWIDEGEMLDVLAISESTPGPISINTATYVGFKVAGVLGSFFATLGLVLPSFLIIYIISLFYKTFMTWEVVQHAFLGIKVGVIILLFRAALKLKKSIKVTPVTITLFVVTLICALVTSIFQLSFKIGSFTISTSLLFILLSLIFGVVLTALNKGDYLKWSI